MEAYSKASACTRLALLILMLMIGRGVSSAQNDSSRFRVNGFAALIINRAFSNITEKEERPDQTSLILRSPTDSGSTIKTGFMIGADVHLGRKESFKTVFGISFSRTGAEHHYSYLERLPTSRAGYTTLTRNTEHDILEVYNALNLHAGIRNRFFSDFFLTSAIVFNSPVKIIRITNGYTRTEYSSAFPGTETFIERVDDERKVYKRGELNLSFRLEAAYQFTLKDRPARVFVFRNFGLIYSLPWWGFGLSYNIL